MERDLRTTDARVVRLLSALVALVAVLVLGAAAAGLLLWREVRAARASVEAIAGGGSLRGTAEEISERQRDADRELVAITREAAREISQFERRAQALRAKGGGAVAEASRAVELTQLMSDQLLLQLKLMAALHGVLEKTVRPLGPERALLRAGEAEPGDPVRAATPPPRARRGSPRSP